METRFSGLKSLFVCGAMLLSATSADCLDFYTEEAPPFSFTTQGKVTGYGVELVRALARRIGSNPSLTVLPWSRAYAMAQGKDEIGLFMMVRTPEREHLFQWVGPVDTSTTGFYARRGSNLRLSSLDDARALDRILVPRDWYSHQLLKDAGFRNLSPVDTPESMVRMVLYGRAQVMVTANVELPVLAAKVQAKPEDFTLLFTLNQVHDYIAFSRTTPAAMVRQWQDALDRMKQDGSFASLYAHWLPGDAPLETAPALHGTAQ